MALFTRFVRGVSVGVVALGLLVLGGYAFHKDILTTLRPGFQGMSIVTAMGLILLGVTLVLESIGKGNLPRYVAGAAAALALFELASHSLYGSDTISGPLARSLFATPAGQAGKTSVATACGLILVALTLISDSRQKSRRISLSEVFAIGGLLISSLAVIGYAYDVKDLYAFSPFNTIALHTAIALLALSMAALCVHPNSGLAAIVAADLRGGAATRRHLAFTLFIPVMGAILLKATDAQHIGPSLAVAVLVILTCAPLCLLILRDGRMQNELELERLSYAAMLVHAKADVDAQLQKRIEDLEQERLERERVEEALRQSQKLEAIGQLTGGVAHDFNNLLTIIKGSSEFLKNADLAPDRRQHYVEAISDTAERAAKLTNQLLAFARRQPLTPELIDVNESVATLDAMIDTLTGSGIHLKIDVPVEPLHVRVDRSQFDAALVNLAVNARDAMAGQGSLSISLKAVTGIPAADALPSLSGDFMALSIEDTGSGISPDNLERIFEPFFTTKEVGLGTGLGLSQVFGFVKQSGGEIRVASKLQKGTVFTLYLPRAVETTDTNLIKVDLGPLVEGQGTCVLLVEDNKDIGTFVNQSLVTLGYRTAWAENAEQALAELDKDYNRFEVVFSDVAMPGMNGIELGQEIRRRHLHLPIILTSGYSDALVQSGTYGFELLRKPYSIEELSRVLRQAATRRRQQLEHD